jgi:hypothetical protein
VEVRKPYLGCAVIYLCGGVEAISMCKLYVFVFIVDFL